jgi:hypothetical protein
MNYIDFRMHGATIKFEIGMFRFNALKPGTLKMEATDSSQTMVTSYQTVERHALEDSNFHNEDFASCFR